MSNVHFLFPSVAQKRRLLKIPIVITTADIQNMLQQGLMRKSWYVTGGQETRGSQKVWKKQVAKSWSDDFTPSMGDRVRSIAQIGKIGRRTPQNLDTDYPSIFITVSEYLRDKSPRNGKQITGRKKRVYAFTFILIHCKQLQTVSQRIQKFQ